MQVISVYDLNNHEALQASLQMRLHSGKKLESPDKVKEAISMIGGRLLFLSMISKAHDMMDMTEHLLRVEKGWLLSQVGLIEDCDDDVMDEQKWSSCTWLLLREFVKMWREQQKNVEEKISNGELETSALENLPLPSIPYYKCRQIMTRADFLEDLDRLNVINIDVDHKVRPDSMLILRAAMEVVEEDGFDDSLDSVRDRIDEIESLHRTRELTFKDVDKGDRIRLSVDKGGASLVED